MAVIGVWVFDGSATARTRRPQIVAAVAEAGGTATDAALIEWPPGEPMPLCSRGLVDARATGAGGPVAERRGFLRKVATAAVGFNYAPGHGAGFAGWVVDDALHDAGFSDDGATWVNGSLKPARSALLVVADRIEMDRVDSVLGLGRRDAVGTIIQEIRDDDAAGALAGFEAR